MKPHPSAGRQEGHRGGRRSILVIIWHQLSGPTARYRELAAGVYDTLIIADRTKRNHIRIRQVEALGYKVTLGCAA